VALEDSGTVTTTTKVEVRFSIFIVSHPNSTTDELAMRSCTSVIKVKMKTVVLTPLQSLGNATFTENVLVGASVGAEELEVVDEVVAGAGVEEVEEAGDEVEPEGDEVAEGDEVEPEVDEAAAVSEVEGEVEEEEEEEEEEDEEVAEILAEVVVDVDGAFSGSALQKLLVLLDSWQDELLQPLTSLSSQ